MSNTDDDKTDWKGFLTALAILPALFVLLLPLMLSYNKQREADRKRYFYPALAAYDQGHYADAEKELKQFLVISPDNSATLYDLGLCTLAEGKKEVARSDFQASVANSGQKMGGAVCGNRHCDDLAVEMLAWMKANPYWDASRVTLIPPFPSVR